MARARRIAAIVMATGVAGLCAWAALTPVHGEKSDELFEIPRGTWARRMAGDKVSILPEQLRLTLGMNDVLLLRNLDEVPQIFGPTLLMPGQSFRLPFAVASRYQFECTAHPSGQMVILVDEFPDTPWRRLLWRARNLWARLPGAAAEQHEPV